MKQKIFAKLLKSIARDRETCKFSRNNENLFTRNSVLSFATIVLFLLEMRKSALQARGNVFFNKLLGGFNIFITKQAISKRRNSFDHTPFEKMHKAVVQEEYSGKYKTALWKGYTILSVDGSYLQLPREKNLVQAFGARGADNFPMAGVSVLYDVLHHWPIDATITHSNMNERTECEKHINYLCEYLPEVAKRSILTLDRGYPSLEMYSFLENKGMKFVVRCCKKSLKEINDSPIGDNVVTLKNGLNLRIIKTDEIFGKEYVLATNLFEFTLLEILDLYAKRWCIETMYRILKEHLFIEGFSGKTVNSIYQDFYATIVILISVAIFQKEGNKMAKEVRKHKNYKYEYEVNLSNLVSTLRDHFVHIVLFHPNEEYVESEIYRITSLIAQSVLPVIKNRRFPRKPKPHYKAKHNLKVRA